MKNKKKLLSIVALATLFSTALAVGTAKLETATPVSADSVSEFKIKDGASVRLATEKEIQEGVAKNGIRFGAYITDAYYAGLTEEYPDATAITLKSTVSKVVAENATAPAPFEYSWDLTDFNSFDAEGVATFYHTITLDSLTGEDLTSANAFDMSADYWIEITNADTTTERVGAQNADSVETTRSMRQVAYMAYTTPSTTEKPNPTYQDETLKKYFSLAEKTSVIRDTDNKAELMTAQVAGKTVNKAYTVDGEAWTDVTDKTLSGETGVFTQADEYAGATKEVVYFDVDNVAYPVATRFVTKLVETSEDIKYLFATKSPYVDNLTDAVQWSGQKSRKGYWLLNANVSVNGSEYSAMYNHRYFENGVFDGNGYALNVTMGKSWRFGLFDTLHNVTIKNMQINFTEEAGTRYDHPGKTGEGYSEHDKALLNTDATGITMFENVCLTLNGLVNTPVETLYLKSPWGDNAMLYSNVVIYIAEGIMAENGQVSGFRNSVIEDEKTLAQTHNAFIIAPVTLENAGDWSMAYTSVEKMATADWNWRGTIDELTQSEWWSYDEENKELVFGKKTK